jgi:NAD(P)H-hydrate epimerase
MVEVLCPDGDEGAAATSEQLEKLAMGKRALAIGPGLGTGEAVRTLVLRALTELGLPTIVDADALGALEGLSQPLRAAAPFAVTPHPGEAARLLGVAIREVQADRTGAARTLAARLGAWVVLKGARTVVATPDGRVHLVTTGNEGLGTAGTGDVLTGLLGGLLAQGVLLEDALLAGVWIHGAAGDAVRDTVGVRGMLASDVIDALPGVLRSL